MCSNSKAFLVLAALTATACADCENNNTCEGNLGDETALLQLNKHHATQSHSGTADMTRTEVKPWWLDSSWEIVDLLAREICAHHFWEGWTKDRQSDGFGKKGDECRYFCSREYDCDYYSYVTTGWCRLSKSCDHKYRYSELTISIYKKVRTIVDPVRWCGFVHYNGHNEQNGHHPNAQCYTGDFTRGTMNHCKNYCRDCETCYGFHRQKDECWMKGSSSMSVTWTKVTDQPLHYVPIVSLGSGAKCYSTCYPDYNGYEETTNEGWELLVNFRLNGCATSHSDGKRCHDDKCTTPGNGGRKLKWYERWKR